MHPRVSMAASKLDVTSTRTSDAWVQQGIEEASPQKSKEGCVIGPSRVLIYDTTLRDGTQGESVSASCGMCSQQMDYYRIHYHGMPDRVLLDCMTFQHLTWRRDYYDDMTSFSHLFIRKQTTSSKSRNDSRNLESITLKRDGQVATRRTPPFLTGPKRNYLPANDPNWLRSDRRDERRFTAPTTPRLPPCCNRKLKPFALWPRPTSGK